MSGSSPTPSKKEPKDSPPKPRGVPKGYIQAKTIQKEEAKAILRERVIARLLPIVDATIDSATGIRHFMLRNPEDGTFKRLTDAAEIDAALAHPDAKEGSSFWIYVKDPQTPAAADLLNRAIGKPVEEVQVEHSGEVGLIDRLRRARERSRA